MSGVAIEALTPFAFTVPEGWGRRMTVVLTADSDSESPPNIVLTREKRGPGEPLEGVAMRSLSSLSRLPQSELLAIGPATVAGRRAFRALIRWSVKAGKVTQSRVWIDGGDGEVLAVTCTAIDAMAAFDALERLLGSLRCDGDPPSAPSSETSAPRDSTPDVPIPGTPALRP